MSASASQAVLAGETGGRTLLTARETLTLESQLDNIAHQEKTSILVGVRESAREGEELSSSCSTDSESSCLLQKIDTDLFSIPTPTEVGNTEVVTQDDGVDNDRKKKPKKRKKKKKSPECEQDESSRKFLRANYFVGIPISNLQVHKSVVAVQESMVQADVLLSSCLVDVASAHLTLFVCHLTDDEVPLACSCLDEFGALHSEEFSCPPIHLTIRNIGHFNNKVVYAGVEGGGEGLERVQALCTAVRDVFVRRGVEVQGQDEGMLWTPHLTIAKLSRLSKRGGHRLRSIPPASYSCHQQQLFGVTVVDRLQLLSMTRPKDEQRYYHCDRCLLLLDEAASPVVEDHSQCCFPRRPTAVTPQCSSQGAPDTSNTTVADTSTTTTAAADTSTTTTAADTCTNTAADISTTTVADTITTTVADTSTTTVANTSTTTAADTSTTTAADSSTTTAAADISTTTAAAAADISTTTASDTSTAADSSTTAPTDATTATAALGGMATKCCS